MSTVTLHIVNETNACRMSCSFISESLIRTAFQCLQLVVTDFLPTMPCTCLQIVVDVAGSFGLQNQELNISLTSIGLLVRWQMCTAVVVIIKDYQSDFFFSMLCCQMVPVIKQSSKFFWESTSRVMWCNWWISKCDCNCEGEAGRLLLAKEWQVAHGFTFQTLVFK